MSICQDDYSILTRYLKEKPFGTLPIFYSGTIQQMYIFLYSLQRKIAIPVQIFVKEICHLTIVIGSEFGLDNNSLCYFRLLIFEPISW